LVLESRRPVREKVERLCAAVDMFMNATLGQLMRLKVCLPTTYLRGHVETRFALKLALKDLGLATDLGRTYNVPMRMATLVSRR
jgi:3-hydroxyisobutyrate dehydrogenase-like beta-hydroxyacid dehydrogenase